MNKNGLVKKFKKSKLSSSFSFYIDKLKKDSKPEINTSRSTGDIPRTKPERYMSKETREKILLKNFKRSDEPVFDLGNVRKSDVSYKKFKSFYISRRGGELKIRGIVDDYIFSYHLVINSYKATVYELNDIRVSLYSRWGGKYEYGIVHDELSIKEFKQLYTDLI